MYRVLREADVGFGNCEETIASIGFYGQRVAYPSMLDDFKASGLNTLALSNNHFMDMGPAPALQGLDELRKRGFTVAGAGANLDAALTRRSTSARRHSWSSHAPARASRARR